MARTDATVPPTTLFRDMAVFGSRVRGFVFGVGAARLNEMT
jgi:hypothetical protein